MDMKTIYLSPHLDDVVYSCGGWIWEQTQLGQEVEIWTICAGDVPPGSLSELARSLHQSWQLFENVVQIRREEDQKACDCIGAIPKHLPFPDCIYRKDSRGEPYYQSGADIFAGLDAGEADLIDQITAALADLLPQEADLIVPLGIGNHVDHELTRKAATRLDRKLRYYADYPYAREHDGQEILRIMENSLEWTGEIFDISEPGLERWWRGARVYASQLSTFWKDEAALREEIEGFSAFLGGMKLWEAVEEVV